MSAEDLTHHQTKASHLWLLIECTDRTENAYEVIDSVDVIAPREKMHTGKSIKYRKGNLILDATIVIISDDKTFLDAELQQILDREIIIKQQIYKCKRIKPSPPSSYGQSCLSRLPSPAWSTSASDHLTQSSTQTNFTPPMTFDQQTQTDLKTVSTKESPFNVGLVQRLNTNLEKLLNDQQILMVENRQMKQQLANITTNFINLQSMMTDVLKKLSNSTSVIVEEHEVESQKVQEPVVLFTCTTTNSKTSAPNRILNLSNSKLNNVAFETIDFNQDSNFSFSNNSRHSIGSNISTVTNTTGSSTINLVAGDNSQGCKLIDIVKSDWTEIDEDPQENVPIGTNNTTVPRYILKQINWTNHSSATRKLLTTLFPREVLATHSLTGKPSPAFLDSKKPVKNQLDSSIISDIIQCVMKECKVSETAVRSSITTKCADENKMLRQRTERKRKSMNVLNDTTNKENKKYLLEEDRTTN